MSRSRLSFRLAAVAILALSLLSIDPAMPARPALSPVAKKPPAPDFTLPDTDGRRVQLSSFRGKVVVLNFWATWCPPCREEMPSMQTLWESLRGQDFELLAINVGEDEDLVFAFRHELSKTLTMPILLDENTEVARRYPIRGLPTTYIIDKQGRIIYQAIGGRDWLAPVIVDTIQALIQEEPN